MVESDFFGLYASKTVLPFLQQINFFKRSLLISHQSGGGSLGMIPWSRISLYLFLTIVLFIKNNKFQINNFSGSGQRSASG